jgi:NAD+ kinase
VEVSRIGIFSQVLFEETIDIITKILGLKESKGISYFLNPELYDFIEKSRPEILSRFQRTHIKDMKVDCIFSIGGDGTILRIARDNPNSPILSINKGRKGFMTEIEAENLISSLKDFYQSKFHLEEHRKITAFYNGERIGSAINEILITSVDLMKPIEFKVYVDNKIISGSLADGIIVATPVGSTGHNLSSGGCVIDPTLNDFIISWINPINLAIRPVILSSSRDLEIICSTRINPIKLVLDGQVSKEYMTPVRFKILLSDETVKFYRYQHFTKRWRHHLHPEIRD